MRRCVPAAAVLALVWTTGCTGLRQVLGFEKQAQQARQIARVAGRLDSEGPLRGPLVVLLVRPVEGERPYVAVDTFVRENAGTYAFPVAAGSYRVGVYEDRNGNGLLDPGERAVTPMASPVLEVGPGETATHDLLLARDATTPPELTRSLDVLGLVARTPRDQRHFSLWAWTVQGALCEDLADPKFGAEAGARGLWQVMDFLNEGLAGIYFLEPYDPARVPVLFVHGISGYPQEFTALIGALDRERFQAWFYFYPSGFDLTDISGHLAAVLERLLVAHRPEALAIVAHSMGGLVARGAILKLWQETGRDDVRLFVTLSTPWGGSESAQSVGSSPVELPPSFSDMNPESDYLRLLFFEDDQRSRQRRLPPSAEFHMMFGFRMKGIGGSANDGSVSVRSQARLEAQEQADSVRAFDRGHVEILSSPEAAARLNRLLAARFP